MISNAFASDTFDEAVIEEPVQANLSNLTVSDIKQVNPFIVIYS